ncbi:HlyD family efflux transporter periplasmic adaptor subunit, partial [Akkermansiaceae bacterium]|nr:HlyD family efflux transporter periplasmic adaptor subunit [Akkermansiaceae bacterium]
LKQEAARGEQAARDWKKIGGGRAPSEMVLRIPFLESARAKATSAQAMLEKARADLDRTSVRAPFDCRVREALLDLGATVMTGAQLGTVYDTAGYEVRLPFSLSNYSLVPENASFIITNEIAGKTYQWNGDLIRTEGDIDRATLSAYVIAAVHPNPVAPAALRLPLPGMFVKAQVQGVALENVISVPRSAVRGRDQIAVMNAEDQLEFRTLSITRSTADQVYVNDGVKSGERVIITKLELPVVGMKLSAMKPQKDTFK